LRGFGRAAVGLRDHQGLFEHDVVEASALLANAISTKNFPSQGDPPWLNGWFQSPGVKFVNQPK
jgi:hypothetical protein